jgi:hypothetical protein
MTHELSSSTFHYLATYINEQRERDITRNGHEKIVIQVHIDPKNVSGETADGINQRLRIQQAKGMRT